MKMGCNCGNKNRRTRDTTPPPGSNVDQGQPTPAAPIAIGKEATR